MLAGLTGLLGGGGGGVTAFESIATVNGTGSSATITFSSIPSTYKDLQIRGIALSSASSSGYIQINGATGSVYSSHRLYGNGTTAASTGSATQTTIQQMTQDAGTANTMAPFIIDILDYASTSKYKTLRSFNGYDANGSGNINLVSGLYQATTAISSLTIVNNGGTFWTTTSQFALYGIKG